MKSAVALVLLLLFSMHSLAAEPPKINRPTLKEPAYQTQPKYFVLLFGPRADTQIWCVHDGDVLYVDKNGSGDLTEAGKRIQIQDGVKEENGYTGYPGGMFDAGEIQSKDGKTTYRRLHIGRYKNSYSVKVEQAGFCGMYTSLSRDERMDRLATAPFCHFFGPLEMYSLTPKLLRKNGDDQIGAAVATTYPGGEWAFVNNEKGVPADAHPVAEISFPGKTTKDPPIVVRVVLNQRC